MLEPRARERLARLRLANPLQATKAEAVLLYAYQAGEIRTTVSDEQLKQLLEKISGKRDTKITVKKK